jgi:HPt (histidine-containing phosphotransfer) domain-containing protein
MSESTLDRQGALLRVGGDEELLKEIAAIFLDDYPKHVAEIRAALATNDAKRLEVSAHTLKGAVGNFGAGIVFESAARLEQMGRAGRVDADGPGSPASHEFAKLEQALSLLRLELQAL